jgi:hypothetical protein
MGKLPIIARVRAPKPRQIQGAIEHAPPALYSGILPQKPALLLAFRCLITVFGRK